MFLKNRKIIKKINRDLIGPDKLKLSLKEAIGFKQLKIEELMYNYISDFIKEKQLFVILEDVEKVKFIFCFINTGRPRIWYLVLPCVVLSICTIKLYYFIV